ncbi:hypothetical protein MMC10_005604 [Thelotrema lepadinum]|nr:hypothetical protein [Thelotrema lepadinum]
MSIHPLSPERDLPYNPHHHPSSDAYLTSLLSLATESSLLRTLCGGVHILDFLTREPGLYQSVLPEAWRLWLASVEIRDLLYLLLEEEGLECLLSRSQREGREPLVSVAAEDGEREEEESGLGEKGGGKCKRKWRSYDIPPRGFVEFVLSVRRVLLDRSFPPPRAPREEGVGGEAEDPPPSPSPPPKQLSRTMTVGMTAKKAHEVTHFASFVDDLASSLSILDPETPTRNSAETQTSHCPRGITHLVDFGSGQNYLGRVLAGPDYERHVIALESRAGNIQGARTKDVHAKMRKKDVVWRNKKVWRLTGVDPEAEKRARGEGEGEGGKAPRERDQDQEREGGDESVKAFGPAVADAVHNRINYVEHVIRDGRLEDVTVRARELLGGIPTNGEPSLSQEQSAVTKEPQFMIISLHSCGNLVHHGLRSLILNDSVKAVAMVGCCYNLCTERLGPPTYKLPTLRSHNRRLEQTTLTSDPHGFPISERFATYKYKNGVGVRFNITARMMAVQAPLNWSEQDCESFFTRHFYRALLQRIFLDCGFVNPPTAADDVIGGSVTGWKGGIEAIVIGTLPKASYRSFVAYVRAAFNKIYAEPEQGTFLKDCVKQLTDADIAAYEERFQHKKHDLCVLWTLMSFAACVVECAMVADRWQYLKEQPQVGQAWVQTVFDYGQSPRNLAVVGIKR